MGERLSEERLAEIRARGESFSGLQYVVTEPRLQWPWTSVLATNQVVDLVRSVPGLLSEVDALRRERELFALEMCRRLNEAADTEDRLTDELDTARAELARAEGALGKVRRLVSHGSMVDENGYCITCDAYVGTEQHGVLCVIEAIRFMVATPAADPVQDGGDR